MSSPWIEIKRNYWMVCQRRKIKELEGLWLGNIYVRPKKKRKLVKENESRPLIAEAQATRPAIRLFKYLTKDPLRHASSQGSFPPLSW